MTQPDDCTSEGFYKKAEPVLWRLRMDFSGISYQRTCNILCINVPRPLFNYTRSVFLQVSNLIPGNSSSIQPKKFDYLALEFQFHLCIHVHMYLGA